jgi:hypothetical protein
MLPSTGIGTDNEPEVAVFSVKVPPAAVIFALVVAIAASAGPVNVWVTVQDMVLWFYFFNNDIV